MTVVLPTSPEPSKATFRYIEYGGRPQMPLGGAGQNIMRLGDRMALDVVLPPMTELDARAWVAAHMAAKASGEVVRMRIPTINGPSGYAVQGLAHASFGTASGGPDVHAGMWFSAVAANGYSYLHMVTSIVGNAINVSPRFRTGINGNVNFNNPVIDGWLDVGFQWDIGVAQIVGLSFSVTEAR